MQSIFAMPREMLALYAMGAAMLLMACYMGLCLAVS